MNNISALVGVEWMFGIAFVNDTVEGWTNPFEVALFAEETLGDNLMGLQVRFGSLLHFVCDCADVSSRSGRT